MSFGVARNTPLRSCASGSGRQALYLIASLGYICGPAHSMRYSFSQFKQLLRVALVALPVLLLLGLNGRMVSLLRPVSQPESRLMLAPRATVIKQKVLLEAASPLASYMAPAFALGWLPDTLPAAWLPRLVRRAVALAPVGTPAIFVAQLCRQRLLGAALSPQAP
jgi:hypothetical protein